jgi:hypothetical protein
MKADLRIFINDYHWNKNLKIKPVVVFGSPSFPVPVADGVPQIAGQIQ